MSALTLLANLVAALDDVPMNAGTSKVAAPYHAAKSFLELMSSNEHVFHSSEVDDQSLQAEGYYIGKISGDGLTTAGAIGPFPTMQQAYLWQGVTL